MNLTDEQRADNLARAEARKATRVKLTPFKHGKRDKATARAVLDNVQQVTPPLVIPWQPHQEKIEKCLRYNRVHAYTLRDIFNLVDRIAPTRVQP